jgi:hypothetical protein
MNAVRIRRRLDSPIPQLPELAPLIGKDVEIIVLEDVSAARVGRPVRFDDLKGGWPDDQLNDGFEEAVDRWRGEPWRAVDALEDGSDEAP